MPCGSDFLVVPIVLVVVQGVTNAAVASQLNSFGALGLTMEHVQKLQDWSKEKVAPCPKQL